MSSDLRTGLYVCPVCEEVFELSGELPLCETCLSLLDRCGAEEDEAEPLCLVG